MRSLPLVIVAALLLVLSCKKKEPEKPTVAGNSPSPGTWTTTTGATTTGGTTTGGATTGGSTTSSALTRFHGTMISTDGIFKFSGNENVFRSGSAAFNTSPIDIPVIEFSTTQVHHGNTHVGTVRLNGDSLFFSGSDYFTNTSSTFTPAQDVWMAAGGNSFPPIQFQNNIPRPLFTSNLAVVPQVISRSAGASFDVSTTNARRGVVAVSDQNTQGSQTPETFTLALQNGNNHVVISAANLSNMVTTQSAVLYLIIENYTTTTTQGKDFKFGRQTWSIQSLTITP